MSEIPEAEPAVDQVVTPRAKARRKARVEARGVTGVLRLSYGTVARRLGSLLIPVAVLFVPLSAVLTVVIAVVFARDGLIVNGDLDVRPVSSPAGVVAGILVVVVALAGDVVAVAATIVMVAGLLAARPVSAWAALRAARRPGTLGILVLVAVVASAVAVVAGMGVVAWTANAWAGVAAIIVVLSLLFWMALALPIAMLEGCGPFSAIGRAWTLTRWRWRSDTVATAVGVLIIPGSAIAGLRWALSPVDGIAHTVLLQIGFDVVTVLAVPFQAATLAVTAMNRWYPVHGMKGWPLDAGGVAERLPAAGSGPWRPQRRVVVWLVALLPLPALLYGGCLWLNPFGLVTTTDHVLGDTNDEPVALHLLAGGRGRPAGLSALSGGRVAMRVCVDRSCSASRLYETSRSGIEAAEMGSAALPDGSVAAVTWTPRGLPGLRLIRCGMTGCEEPEQAPIVERWAPDSRVFSTFGTGVAATVTKDGILIAAMTYVNQHSVPRGTPEAWLRLIHCADVRCARPRAVTLASLTERALGRSGRPVAMAAGRDGRPVVVFEDQSTGEVVVVSCDALACAQPVVTRYGGHTPIEDDSNDGVSVVVPPDDRPVIAYRDVRTGAARLLHCRTFECAQADTVPLTGPGAERPWPALTLDHDGRPLVATYDLAHGNVVVIACGDFGCTRHKAVPIARVGNRPGFVDLKVSADGRPQVLWAHNGDGDEPLHLTTCARPRCGA